MSGRLSITTPHVDETFGAREMALTLQLGDVSIEILGRAWFWASVAIGLSEARALSGETAGCPKDAGEGGPFDRGVQLVGDALQVLDRGFVRQFPQAVDVVVRVRVADRDVEAVSYGAMPLADGCETPGDDGDAGRVGAGEAGADVDLRAPGLESRVLEIADQCARCGGRHFNGPAPEIAELIASIEGERRAEVDVLVASARGGPAPDEADVGDAGAVRGADAPGLRIGAIDPEIGAELQHGKSHGPAPCAESVESGSGRP